MANRVPAVAVVLTVLLCTWGCQKPVKNAVPAGAPFPSSIEESGAKALEPEAPTPSEQTVAPEEQPAEEGTDETEAAAPQDDQADDEEWTTTESGLKYKDTKVGTGDEAASGSNVAVHYTGTLDDGS